jgi:hypothetical protein
MAEPWVVHNIGAGVKWENTLFDYKIEAHFRYPANAGINAKQAKVQTKTPSI